jgi:hypothetical protein
MKDIQKIIGTSVLITSTLIPISVRAETSISQFNSVITQIGTVNVGSLPAFKKPVNVNLPPAVTGQVGNVNFSCAAGTTAHNCLPINAFGGLTDLNPQTLGEKQGQIPTTIGNVGGGIIKGMKVSQFKQLFPQSAARLGTRLSLDPEATVEQAGIAQAPVTPEIMQKRFSEYANAGVKVTLKKLGYNPKLEEALDLKKHNLLPQDAVKLNIVLKSEIPVTGAKVLTGTNLQAGVRCSGPCDVVETTEGAILYSADKGETACVKGGLGYAAGWTCEPAGVTLGRHFDLTLSIHEVDPKKGQFRMQVNQNICWYTLGIGKACLAHLVPVPIPITVRVDKGNPYYSGIYVGS